MAYPRKNLGRSVQRRARRDPGGSGSSREERPLTARDVAELCGVELKTIHNWVERRLLPHFRTPGRHLRFRSADVQEFLSRHTGTSDARIEVIVIGGARRRGTPGAWLTLKDAYEGLCRAGTERPSAVVIEAKGLQDLDAARYVRALRRCLPDARLFWMGAAGPRLGKNLERVSGLEDVRDRLASA